MRKHHALGWPAMVDYYSILLRAVTAPGAGDAHWRRGIYDRSRQMLSTRMNSLEPQPLLAEIAAEEAKLEAAIERVEAELSWTERHASQTAVSQKAVARKAQAQKAGSRRVQAPRAPSKQIPLQEALTGHAAAEPDQYDEAADGPFATDPDAISGPRRLAWIALAIVIAALGAGGYIFVSSGHKAPPAQQAQATAAPNPAAPKLASAGAGAPPKLAAVNTGKNGELAPGVDGGASDPDQQYVFRRQPTFYRTLQPVGTVIVDKLQHFLYLIQPNNVALRYGIAVGEQCANLAGMRHIANMAEWPTWQPPPEMLSRNPTPLPGGPGNPLGARMLQLDDGNSRINGTNAPKTIGNPVSFGCIRLNNDDITDLYGRVKLSTPVVVN
jgi:lipoprotein-anchoring transpeptidase ErfK/SrfK